MRQILDTDGLAPRIAERPFVYGIGFIALDLVRSAVPRASVNAYAGGTCANVLAVLAYLGWNAAPIARLNSDSASQSVREDLRRVGVMLGLAEIWPTVSTPIVVQVITRGPGGISRYRFEWECPGCGTALPQFRPVPASAVGQIAEKMARPSVFFMDRVSRSSLELAKIAMDRGALVYFEPSEIPDPKLFKQALRLAHIVKYSKDRLRSLGQDGVRSGILLEIRTLGSHGLMYRSRFAGKSGWVHLPSVPAPIVVDACGAGDWCSAGIIASLGAGGLAGLLSDGQNELPDALRFGQALAAWNCRFEGARGGMYRVKRSTFVRQVKAILGPSARSGINQTRGLGPLRTSSVASVVCPACPANGRPMGRMTARSG